MLYDGSIARSMVMKGKAKRRAGIILILLLTLSLTTVVSHGLSYHEPDYMCTQMTRDLEQILESIGLDVKIMSGYSPAKQEGHIWIKVYGIEIDSVWLLPVKNSDIYNYNLHEFDSYSDFTSFCEM